jgi:hypothetical protein
MLHLHDTTADERAKYSEIWETPDYKKYSPGLENVERFIKVLEPYAGASLIDIGCGAGVAGLQFEKLMFDVTWLDLTDAGLHEDVDRHKFIEAPIWSSNWGNNQDGWTYGFCCDVLEHIPTEYTMLTIDKIVSSCATSWIQIALTPDVFGQAIGKPLHLTVQSYKWWLDRIATIGNVIDARDLCGLGLYVVRQ